MQFARSSGVFAADRFGYADANSAGGTITQYNSTGAANTVTNAGAGLYSVALPGLGTAGPQAGDVQATAVNAAAGARCKVVSWQSSANGQFFRVYCFSPAGMPANKRRCKERRKESCKRRCKERRKRRCKERCKRRCKERF
ncbi:hypothetical protein [Dactylosporangium sp. NPDC000521]|uniref:hypothetical protein n=1 Tax=Dactylosporangium sp. NPDC000521 TaxID=3363975 RepID=UPI0036B9C5C0